MKADQAVMNIKTETAVYQQEGVTGQRSAVVAPAYHFVPGIALSAVVPVMQKNNRKLNSYPAAMLSRLPGTGF